MRVLLNKHEAVPGDWRALCWECGAKWLGGRVWSGRVAVVQYTKRDLSPTLTYKVKQWGYMKVVLPFPGPQKTELRKNKSMS